MSFLLILPLSRVGGDKAREQLIRRYSLDYTHVLQMTFDLWDAIDAGDLDVLRSAVENYLHRRLPSRRMFSFEEMVEAVELAANAVHCFYDAIQPHLQDILDRHINPAPPSLELKGWLTRSPVIQVSLKHEPIPTVYRAGLTHQRGLAGVHGYRDIPVIDGPRPLQSV